MVTLCNTERASFVHRLRRPKMTPPLCRCKPASQTASFSAEFCALFCVDRCTRVCEARSRTAALRYDCGALLVAISTQHLLLKACTS